MIKPGKKTLVLAAVYLILIFPAYFLFVDLFMVRSYRSFSWHPMQFLLEEIPSPKVIVVSGSNSDYAFNAITLENHFGVPVGLHAYNATYPLRLRVYTVDKYVSKGDLLILPLEWHFYMDDEEYGSFAQEHFADGKYNHLYDELPLHERLDFVFRRLTLGKFAYGVQRWNAVYHFDGNREQELKFIEKKLLENRGGQPFEYRDINRPEYPDYCANFLLRRQLSEGFGFSNRFLKDLELLEKLKDKGVDVIFTYPTMIENTSAPCFDQKQTAILKDYADKIKAVVQEKGFDFIGKLEESIYPMEFYADSPYHLTAEGMNLHTSRFIKRLTESGYKARGEGADFSTKLDQALKRHRTNGR